jgi:hypothetical protein
MKVKTDIHASKNGADDKTPKRADDNNRNRHGGK